MLQASTQQKLLTGNIMSETVVEIAGAFMEDFDDEGYKPLTDEELYQLAREGAERQMASNSDAIIGLFGAGMFNFIGVETWQLVVGGLGLLMFAFFVRGAFKNFSRWTVFIGFPAVAVFLGGLGNKMGISF